MQHILRYYGSFFIVACLISALCSCRTTQTAEKSTCRDSVNIAVWHYDSIFIDRSSNQEIRNDTVFVTRTETAYRFRYVHDTIFSEHVDSIPYEVIKEVEKKERDPPWLAPFICCVVCCLVVLLSCCFVVLSFCSLSSQRSRTINQTTKQLNNQIALNRRS